MSRTVGQDEDPEQGLIERMLAVLARCALTSARADQVAEIHDFAARLIGPGIASTATLARVHALSGAALFHTREQGELTGALAVIILSPDGLAAVEVDRFDGVALDAKHLAKPDERAAGVYAWGVAATTALAGRRVIAGARAIGRLAEDGRLPCFARAATTVGRRLLLQRLTFRPLPQSRSGLLVFQRPQTTERAA